MIQFKAIAVWEVGSKRCSCFYPYHYHSFTLLLFFPECWQRKIFFGQYLIFAVQTSAKFRIQICQPEHCMFLIPLSKMRWLLLCGFISASSVLFHWLCAYFCSRSLLLLSLLFCWSGIVT